jgi:hypothetical protein
MLLIHAKTFELAMSNYMFLVLKPAIDFPSHKRPISGNLLNKHMYHILLPPLIPVQFNPLPF